MFNIPFTYLPTTGSTILLLFTAMAVYMLEKYHHQDMAKLKHKCMVTRALSQIADIKSAGLGQELEATRTELAQANKRYKEEVVKNKDLEKKLKESEKTVRLPEKSNRQTRDIARDLISEKVALKQRIVNYTAQLRTAKEDYDVWIDFGTKLKERAEKAESENAKLEQENSKLKLERSHLALQLSSERSDSLDLTLRIKHKCNELCALTRQIDEYKERMGELRDSNEKAWREVRAWREHPIGMMGKAQDWKEHLGGRPLLGGERDEGLTWDEWKWMEGMRDELEVQADDVMLDLDWGEDGDEEGSGEPEQVVEWEDEEWEEALDMEEESGETEEGIEVEDEEWEEVEIGEEGVW